MATIIDSLIVKLGLDSSDYDSKRKKLKKDLKDTGDEAEGVGKKIKGAGKTTTASFDEMAKGATKFLAVLGGTSLIKQFVNDTIESSAALERFSKNLGRAVEDVSAYGNAVEIAGGSSGGLQSSLDMLSKSQTELQLTGQSKLIPFFSALGVSMSDAYGKAVPVTDLLLNLGQALMERTGDRQQAFNMGQMMGIDEGTLNLILRGRKEAERLIATQKNGVAVTKQQAEAAEKLRARMVGGRQEFQALGRELLMSAVPSLEKILDLFSKVGDWVKENAGFVEKLLTVIAVGFTAITVATLPISATTLALTAFGAALALLWDDYSVWQKGGNSQFGEMWEGVAPAIDKAKNALTLFRDVLQEVFYRSIALWDAMYKAGNGDFAGAKEAAMSAVRGSGNGGPGDTGSGARTTAPSMMPGRGDGALGYFKKQGWTEEQAAGIVANLNAESRMDPAASGDNGKAYGIAQWHPDRQAQFQKLFGKPIQGSSVEEQLAFVQHELTQGNEQAAGNRLRGARTAREAGALVSSHYERPADKLGEAAKRGMAAEGLLMGIPGASQAANGGTGSPRGAGGNVSTTIGEVKVYTDAKDADGIARDMVGALDKHMSTSQANYGQT